MSEGFRRPYRLRMTHVKAKRGAGEYMRWRNFAVVRNAHNAALVEARWSRVGTTIEVMNHDRARMLGQYTRTLTSVSFSPGAKHDVEAEAREARQPSASALESMEQVSAREASGNDRS